MVFIEDDLVEPLMSYQVKILGICALYKSFLIFHFVQEN